jgi:hypothetical protein
MYEDDYYHNRAFKTLIRRCWDKVTRRRRNTLNTNVSITNVSILRKRSSYLKWGHLYFVSLETSLALRKCHVFVLESQYLKWGHLDFVSLETSLALRKCHVFVLESQAN